VAKDMQAVAKTSTGTVESAKRIRNFTFTHM